MPTKKERSQYTNIEIVSLFYLYRIVFIVHCNSSANNSDALTHTRAQELNEKRNLNLNVHKTTIIIATGALQCWSGVSIHIANVYKHISMSKMKKTTTRDTTTKLKQQRSRVLALAYHHNYYVCSSNVPYKRFK